MASLGRIVVLRRSGEVGGSIEAESDLTIGRDPNQCELVINLRDVSKVHARLQMDWQAKKVWIQNLSKTNPQGTMVNGEPISGRQSLRFGDVITIIDRKFRFEESSPPAVALERTERVRRATPKKTAGEPRDPGDENAGQKPVQSVQNAMASPSVRSALVARRAAIVGQENSSVEASPHPAAKKPFSVRKKSPSRTSATEGSQASAPKDSSKKKRADAAVRSGGNHDRSSLMAQLHERFAMPSQGVNSKPAAAVEAEGIVDKSCADAKDDIKDDTNKSSRPSRTPVDATKPATPKVGSSKQSFLKFGMAHEVTPIAGADKGGMSKAYVGEGAVPEIARAKAEIPNGSSANAAVLKPANLLPVAGNPATPKVHEALEGATLGVGTPHNAASAHSSGENTFMGSSPDEAGQALPKTSVIKSSSPKIFNARVATPVKDSDEGLVSCQVNDVVDGIFAAVARPTPNRSEETHATLCAMIEKRWTPTSMRKVVSKTPASNRRTSAKNARSISERRQTPKMVTSKTKLPKPENLPVPEPPAGGDEAVVKQARSSLRGSMGAGRKGLRVSFGSNCLELTSTDLSPQVLPSPTMVKLSPTTLCSPAEGSVGPNVCEVSRLLSVVDAKPLPLVRSTDEPRRRSVKFQRTSEESLRFSTAGELDDADGPASERKRKPIRQSWEQTPGRKVDRRSSKTPAAKQRKVQPTPATNAPHMDGSTTLEKAGRRCSLDERRSSGVGSVLRSTFTPNAASIVSGLLEGEFTPLCTVQSDCSELGVSPGTIQAFGLFRLGAPGFTPASRPSRMSSAFSACPSNASATPGGPTWSEASTPASRSEVTSSPTDVPYFARPMHVPPFEPTVGTDPLRRLSVGKQHRPNMHIRFVDGRPVRANGDTWAGIMKYDVAQEVEDSEEPNFVATPVEVSIWGRWDEVQEWNDDEWAEAEVEEWGDEEAADDTWSTSPGAHLRRPGAHIRFTDSPSDPKSSKSSRSSGMTMSRRLSIIRSIARQSLEGVEELPLQDSVRKPPVSFEKDAVETSNRAEEDDMTKKANEDVPEGKGSVDEGKAIDTDNIHVDLQSREDIEIFGLRGVLASTRGTTPPAHRASGRWAGASFASKTSPGALDSASSTHSMIIHSDVDDDGATSQGQTVDQNASPVCKLSFTPQPAATAVAVPLSSRSTRSAGRRSSTCSSVLTPAVAPTPNPTPASRVSFGSSRRASMRHSNVSSCSRKGSDVRESTPAHAFTGMFDADGSPNVPAEGQEVQRFVVATNKPVIAPTVPSAYSLVMPSPGSARMGRTVAEWPQKKEQFTALLDDHLSGSEVDSEVDLYEEDDDVQDWVSDLSESAQEAPLDEDDRILDDESTQVDCSPAPLVCEGTPQEPSSISRIMLPVANMPVLTPNEEFGSVRKVIHEPLFDATDDGSLVATHTESSQTACHTSVATFACASTAPSATSNVLMASPNFNARDSSSALRSGSRGVSSSSKSPAPSATPKRASSRLATPKSERARVTPLSTAHHEAFGVCSARTTPASLAKSSVKGAVHGEHMPVEFEQECALEPFADAGMDRVSKKSLCSESLTRDELECLKVVDLRSLLDARGLFSGGRKAELVDRLVDAQSNLGCTPSGDTQHVHDPKLDDKIGEMKVVQLRALLVDSGLDASGKKAELVARVIDAVRRGHMGLADQFNSTSSSELHTSEDEGDTPSSAQIGVRSSKRVRFGAENVECAITPAPSLRKSKRSKPDEAPSSVESTGSVRRSARSRS